MKNAITWFAMPCLDFDRAVKFYSTILGTEMHVDEGMGQRMGMFPMDQDGGVSGAIVGPNPYHRPSIDGTRVYLNCDGILDDVLGRVEKAGGAVIMPKMSIGEHGCIAMIEDVEGNTVGLHSPK